MHLVELPEYLDPVLQVMGDVDRQIQRNHRDQGVEQDRKRRDREGRRGEGAKDLVEGKQKYLD